jgi:hypothetical protein
MGLSAPQKQRPTASGDAPITNAATEVSMRSLGVIPPVASVIGSVNPGNDTAKIASMIQTVSRG